MTTTPEDAEQLKLLAAYLQGNLNGRREMMNMVEGLLYQTQESEKQLIQKAFDKFRGLIQNMSGLNVESAPEEIQGILKSAIANKIEAEISEKRKPIKRSRRKAVRRSKRKG